MVPLRSRWERARRQLQPGRWRDRLAAWGAVLPGSPDAWRRAALAAAVTVAVAAIVGSAVLPPALGLEVGEVAPRTIKAPRDFVDRERTEAERRRAAARVPAVYTEDPSAAAATQQEIREAFAAVRTLQAEYRQAAQQGTAASPARWATRLSEELGLRLTEPVAMAVLRAGPATLAVLEAGALEVARSVLAEGIKPEALDAARRRVPEAVRPLELDRPYEAFVSLLVQSRLRPNLFLDERATERAREQAAQQVPPVVVKRHEVIVREGEKVTATHLALLRDAGLLRREGDAARGAGVLLLSALVVAAAGIYLYLFERRAYEDGARLLALAVTGTGALLLARLVLAVPELEMMVPLAAGPMLAALLVSPRVGLALAGLLAPLVGLMAGGELVHVLAGVLGSGVGVFAVHRVGARSDLMRAGLQVGAVQLLAVLGDGLAGGAERLTDPGLWLAAAGGAGGGLLAAMLTLGFLPVLEGAFGIVSPVRLLELANPNHPLLRRLLLEAPGTYHHSLMVANLAEAAAEQVGGDSLLARVGAYYHDIGKLKRPAFFVENQLGGMNPHDRLSPNLSALIITSHVRDGVELARRHGLPREIIRFIEEHHGTLRLEYFYRKAEESAQGVMGEHFRYPGPVPQTRETAICMLADGCEAAVRALSRPTPDRIAATVRKVIRERLNEGQLDRCDLTLRDLDAIAETFTRVLTGVFHQRIEYPEGTAEAEANGTGTRRGRPAGEGRREPHLPGRAPEGH